MRRTIDIYLRLISVQIRSQMQYRASFLMSLSATALITFLGFGSLAMVFWRFDNIGGWTLWEVGFLYGMVEAAFGTMDLFFSGFNPHIFSRLIRMGTLDQILLRPLSVTLQVLGSSFIMKRLSRISQGALIFVISVAMLDVHWTPAKVAYLPLVFFGLMCFFGGFFVIGSTLTFWTVQPIEVVNIFTYGGREMIAYPMHIYERWMRDFFTYIVPAIFLNYYPALYFLEKPDPFGMPDFAPFLAPVVGVGMLVASFAFWSYGIRHYQSTAT